MATDQSSAAGLTSALEAARRDALAKLAQAADEAGVEALRVETVGRSGSITGLLRRLGEIPAAERPAAGALANEVRRSVQAAIEERLAGLHGEHERERLANERLDMTMPGRPVRIGHLHPTMSVERQLR